MFSTPPTPEHDELLEILMSLVDDPGGAKFVARPLTLLVVFSDNTTASLPSRCITPEDAAGPHFEFVRTMSRPGVIASGFVWKGVPPERQLLPDHDCILHIEWVGRLSTLTRGPDHPWTNVTPKLRSPFPPFLPHATAAGQA